jgi:hypothetical protein
VEDPRQFASVISFFFTFYFIFINGHFYHFLFFIFFYFYFYRGVTISCLITGPGESTRKNGRINNGRSPLKIAGKRTSVHRNRASASSASPTGNPTGNRAGNHRKSPPICFTGDIWSGKIGSLSRVHDLSLLASITLYQSLIFDLSHGRVKKKRRGREKWKRREKKKGEEQRAKSGEERKEKKRKERRMGREGHVCECGL